MRSKLEKEKKKKSLRENIEVEIMLHNGIWQLLVQKGRETQLISVLQQN